MNGRVTRTRHYQSNTFLRACFSNSFWINRPPALISNELNNMVREKDIDVVSCVEDIVCAANKPGKINRYSPFIASFTFSIYFILPRNLRLSSDLIRCGSLFFISVCDTVCVARGVSVPIDPPSSYILLLLQCIYRTWEPGS